MIQWKTRTAQEQFWIMKLLRTWAAAHVDSQNWKIWPTACSCLGMSENTRAMSHLNPVALIKICFWQKKPSVFTRTVPQIYDIKVKSLKCFPCSTTCWPPDVSVVITKRSVRGAKDVFFWRSSCSKNVIPVPKHRILSLKVASGLIILSNVMLGTFTRLRIFPHVHSWWHFHNLVQSGLQSSSSDFWHFLALQQDKQA